MDTGQCGQCVLMWEKPHTVFNLASSCLSSQLLTSLLVLLLGLARKDGITQMPLILVYFTSASIENQNWVNSM